MNTSSKVAGKVRSISSFRGVIQDSLLPMLIKAGGTIVTFVLSVLLARVLGIVEFSLYSLVVSTVMVLSIPVRSGVQILATRETSKALKDGAPSVIGYLYSWSNRIIYTYTLSIFGIVLLIWFFAVQNNYLSGLLLSIVSVGTLSLTLRNSAILRGFKSFGKGTSPDILIRPLVQSIMFLVFLFVFVWSWSGALSGLFAFVVGSIVAYIFSEVWLRCELSDIASAQVKAVPAEWRKSLLFLTVVGGGQVLFGHIDTLMLGVLGETGHVGAYRVSVQISMLLIFILTVVNQILQPSLVWLYRANDINGMQKLVSDSSFFMFLITLVLGLGLMFFAVPLIDLTYGSNYTIASVALQILVAGQVLNVSFGSVGTILNMTGMEKEAVISIIIAIIVNIILDVLLIPAFGMVGAASASAISIFVWNMVSRHYVKTQVGIESSGLVYKLGLIVAKIF